MSELTGINIPTLDFDAVRKFRLRSENSVYTEDEIRRSQNWYYVRKRRAEENLDHDNEQYERTWSAIDTLGKKLKAHLVDRTRTIDQFYKILGPLPEIPSTPVDYHAACDEKAKLILQECADRDLELRVSWSGGIDSTNAIVALLKFYEDYPTVEMKVCLNQKSIDEYPWMYENIIQPNPRIEEYRGETLEAEGKGENEALGHNMARDTGKDYLVVTGELGDQIFGAKILVPDIKQNGTEGMVKKHYAKVFSPDMTNFLKPLIDAMPEEWPRDCGNVMHWMNFILKWQWCQLRMFIMYPVPYQSYRHFFDHDALQQWCLQNDMQVKMPEYDLKRYKEVAKRYIADWTGDEEYFRNKEKEDSQRCTVNVFISDEDAGGFNPDEERRHWSAVDLDFKKYWKNSINHGSYVIDDDTVEEGEFVVGLKAVIDL
jgi:hypothetical protein